MNQRSQQVLEALHVDPGGSVNAAFDKWADTLAAYRLFDNNAVTSEAILKGRDRGSSMLWWSRVGFVLG